MPLRRRRRRPGRRRLRRLVLLGLLGSAFGYREWRLRDMERRFPPPGGQPTVR